MKYFTKLMLQLVGIAPLYALGGKGGGGQTKTQKENDELNNKLLKQQLASVKNQSAEPPQFQIPKAPVYAPPPSQTSADTEAAAQEYRRAAKRRRGFLRSKLAGENKTSPAGASAPPSSAVSSGTRTTLG